MSEEQLFLQSEARLRHVAESGNGFNLPSEPSLDLREPSLLPAWSRGHVWAHLARNADGIIRLCSWAATGKEHFMYQSAATRESEIEEWAGVDPTRLIHEVERSSLALEHSWRTLEERTAIIRWGPGGKGPSVPISDLLWRRTREIEVHLVDLRIGFTFADCDTRVLDRILREEAMSFQSRVTAFEIEDEVGIRYGAPDGSLVTGEKSDLVAWLLGRADQNQINRLSGNLPTLPAWL